MYPLTTRVVITVRLDPMVEGPGQVSSIDKFCQCVGFRRRNVMDCIRDLCLCHGPRGLGDCLTFIPTPGLYSRLGRSAILAQ